MTRFLLSAVAVCVLCVSLTGSAAAGSKTRQSWVTSSGIAVDQEIRQSGSGKSIRIESNVVIPNGGTQQHKYKQNHRGASIQIKGKLPDGTSFKTRYKDY